MKKLLTIATVLFISTQTFANDHSIMNEIQSEHALMMDVHKSEYCGCCANWIDYMEESGYELTTHIEQDMNPIKEKYNVSQNLQSCHTATYGNLVIEGHVPHQAIEYTLEKIKEGIDIVLISVPGMPANSPGMDMNTDTPYTVVGQSSNGDLFPIMSFVKNDIVNTHF